MSTVNELSTAIHIAASAHEGQLDRAGRPYILHPLRVMAACVNDNERIVAVLHDVVEDTDWTFEKLIQAGIGIGHIDSLRHLTRPRTGTEEGYLEWIGMCRADVTARQVKMLDIFDNMDMSRFTKPLTDADLARVSKYHKALRILRYEWQGC